MLLRPHRALWILVIALAACATNPVDPGIRQLQAQPQAQATPSPIQQALPFLADVGLTAAQTQQIEAVIKRRWPAPDQQEAQQSGQAFQTALLAQTVDQEQLRPLLAKSETDQRTSTMALVGALQDVRPLLSAAQRAKAIATLTAPPRPQPSPSPPPSPTPEQQALALTEEQQTLFAAVQPEQQDAGAVPKAIAGMLSTGNAKALTTALTPARTVDEQVDATLAALSSLTLAQRQAMFGSEEGESTDQG